MKLLLHICCGPCLFYPWQVLQRKNINTTGYFFNPNIHPFREFERRTEALRTVAERFRLAVIWDEVGYGLDRWFNAVGDKHDQERRCPACYRLRLDASARMAANRGMDAFTTTLLYSRYQRHDLIAEAGREFAARHGVKFYYHDFRQGWKEGIRMAVDSGIYRQPYCGCLFSERERYAKREKRLAASLVEMNACMQGTGGGCESL